MARLLFPKARSIGDNGFGVDHSHGVLSWSLEWNHTNYTSSPLKGPGTEILLTNPPAVWSKNA